MKPSPLRISARRSLIRDDGMSTFSCSARLALRTRVRKSAMGSLLMAASPARLEDARHFALERELAETQAPQLELAQGAAGQMAHLAPVIAARREPGGARPFYDEGDLGHGSCRLLSERHS